IRQGFVYERVPHITLKSIANNAEIDVIWEKFQAQLGPLREQLNKAMVKDWQEWEMPREAEDRWPSGTRTIFYELRQEQSRGDAADKNKLQDALAVINYNLSRKYTL